MKNNIIKVSRTNVGSSAWVPLKNLIGDWTIMVENPSGLTVTVEATLVDVKKDVPTSDQAYPITNLTSITTGGIFGSLPKVSAVRLNIEVGSGVSSMTILQ